MEGLYFLGFLFAIVSISMAVSRTAKSQKRIDALEREVTRLRSALNALWQKNYGSSFETSAPVAPSAPVQPSEQQTTETELAPPKPVLQVQRSRTQEEWEALIGGKLLNRIGALALIFAVGFFLKYAFDNNLISEAVRVAIGGVAGIALLLIAMLTRKKGLEIFAQGLSGSGIAILYLSDYAAFNFYSLISQPVAFVIMSLITVLALQQAFSNNSLAISLLGWAGGFLTPFLLSTANPSEIGLFTYILLLDIGLLVVAMRKSEWAILEILSLVATTIVYWAWYDNYGISASFALTLCFVLAFWLLFFVLDVFHALKQTRSSNGLLDITGAANALLCFLELHDLVNHWDEAWTAAFTLGLGLAYFALLLLFYGKPERTVFKQRYSLTAMAFLVIATALEFSDFYIVMLWSVEAVALLWCGLHWKSQPVWIAALCLLGLSVMGFFVQPTAFSYMRDHEFTLLWNLRAATLLILCASCALGALILRNTDNPNSHKLQAVLHSGWGVLLFVLLTVETLDAFEVAKYSAGDDSAVLTYLRNLQQLTLSGVWLLYSIVLMGFGIWRRLRGLRIFAMILFGITIIKAFFFDLSFLETPYRIVSFVALGLILLGVSYLYQRFKAFIFDLKAEEAVN